MSRSRNDQEARDRERRIKAVRRAFNSVIDGLKANLKKAIGAKLLSSTVLLAMLYARQNLRLDEEKASAYSVESHGWSM